MLLNLGFQVLETLLSGVAFKIAEAQFFLDKMGKVLVPPRYEHPFAHPAWSGASICRWQPDFYFYLDAFVMSARSVPDVIQKCLGWDDKSKDEWDGPITDCEVSRRKAFKTKFQPHYSLFNRLPLSRCRVGTAHWLGVPSVETRARAFCGPEFTGSPLRSIPVAASREVPPGTDPAIAFLYGKSLPVEPSWSDFVLRIPKDDGTDQEFPLFDQCKSYVKSIEDLAREARRIGLTVHETNPLTSPPAARRH